MKIIIIVPSLAPKGPVLVAADTVRGLVDAGHFVSVFYLDDKFGANFECTVEKLSFKGLGKISGADIIHSHSLRPDLISWCLKNILRYDAKFVSTIHNYVEYDLGMERSKFITFLVSAIWRLAWKGLDNAVSLTHHAQNYYLTTIPKVKTSVVYNTRYVDMGSSVDEEDMILLNEIRKRFQVIGANSLVIKRKNLGSVLEALVYLPDYAFVLVGDGNELQHLKSKAEELGIADRFISIGSRIEAYRYLKFYDAYVMPSLSEGMPLSLLEAVQYEVPVVCSDLLLFRELFGDNEVLFFDLDDSKSLAIAIEKVQLGKVEYAENAKARFESNYSMSAMIDSYTSVYKQ